MKKVLTMLFAAALVIGFTMPVFAQDTAAPASDSGKMTKKKPAKAKKPKKEAKPATPPSK